jgi:RNA polymerase sigma factor (sigma-70 family)
MILDLVCKNTGNKEDAADVFQEGMIVIFEKTNLTDFTWNSSVKTFLFAVCRNKWLMELRRRKSKETDTLLDLAISDGTSIEQDIMRNERHNLMRKHFENLGADCQKVMTMFFQKFSLRQISIKMGYSEAYSKKRKFTCQKKLIALIANDPLYIELTE